MRPSRSSLHGAFAAVSFAFALANAEELDAPPEGGGSNYQQELTLFSFKKSPPLIDGKLEDESWKGTQVARGFMKLGAIEAAAVDTEVRSCFDGQFLYFAVKVNEPAMEKTRPGPSDAPWQGDRVELFLDTKAESAGYWQIIIDVAGNAFVGRADPGTPGVSRVSDFAFEFQVARRGDHWSVEMAVPFASLGVRRPADNERWGFNVARGRQVEPENSSWAALNLFAEREKFGHLAFFSRQEVEADITYWDAKDHDPLMRRAEVSGVEIAKKFLGKKNLLPNGGFEEGDKFAGDWQFVMHSASGTKASNRWTDDAHAGDKAIELIGTEQPGEEAPRFGLYSDSFECSEGHHLISGYYKTTEAALGQITVLTYGTDEEIEPFRTSTLGAAHSFRRILEPSAEWKYFEQPFRFSEGTKQAVVELRGWGLGSIFFDEVKLTEVTKRVPDLWSYFPFEADKSIDKTDYGQGGLGPKTKEKHPQFHQAAMDFNTLLVRYSFLEDKIRTATRAGFYEARLGSKPSADGAAALARIEQSRAELDGELNDLFQMYGRAFEAGRDLTALPAIEKGLTALAARIQTVEQALEELLSGTAAGAAAMVSPWAARDLAVAPAEEYLNKDGVNLRYQFTGFRNTWEESLMPLVPIESFHVDWPSAVPDPEETEPGEFSFTRLDQAIAYYMEVIPAIKNLAYTPGSWTGNDFPSTAWLLEKVRLDPDIALQTEKGKKTDGTLTRFGNPYIMLNSGHPESVAYMRGYLKRLAAEAAEERPVDYFLTSWEGKPFHHVGYNPGRQEAFREYLRERYASLEVLNRQWGSGYESFAAIPIPYEMLYAPPKEVSGLSYEFERWRRVDYIRRAAQVRSFLREGLPGVPVMTDPSHFLSYGMTGYLFYRENAMDIASFHTAPGREEPMWVYLSTMNRKFGKVTGYFENYFGMWRSAHPSDERLAKRDMDKFFFELFLRDVRYSAWWLRFSAAPTPYVVAYNENVFRLVYDQTIYRWSSTALPVMFDKCQTIEKTLLESRQETPVTAIIQPCASIINIAGRQSHVDGHSSKLTDPVQLMFELHNRLLSGANVAHDYLPEEMVLDGMASLDDYTVLFLPLAPYLSAEFSRRLSEWVERGGTLVAFGPFGQENQFGQALSKEESLFRKLFPNFRSTGPGDWDFSLEGGAQKDPPAVTNKIFGKGRLVFLNGMLDVFLRDPVQKESMEALVRDVCRRTAHADHADLQIFVREGQNGERYLGLCNRDVENALETTVMVEGQYAQAFDLLVPGWFPVPAKINGAQTHLPIRLAPSEWTVLRLE